ncbi:MAG: 4Fe-4S binding protein [Bacillota bacterium]
MSASKTGAVAIDAEMCKGCGLCVSVCPRGVLALGDKLNNGGYQVVQVVDGEKCNGCTLCAVICPDVVLKVYR